MMSKRVAAASSHGLIASAVSLLLLFLLVLHLAATVSCTVANSSIAAAASSSSSGDAGQPQVQTFSFVKHHDSRTDPLESGATGDESQSDESTTHDEGDDDEFVLINVTEFVARVKGGLKQAKRIAKKYNLKLVRRVFEKQNYFLFKRESISNSTAEAPTEAHAGHDKAKRSRRNKPLRRRYRRSTEDPSEVEKLKHEPTIEWIQEQIPKIRKKRDYVSFASNDYNFNSNIDYKGHDATGLKFNDPMWSRLWYINPEEKFTNSMRIKEAWKRGYTGKDVVVTILDDGLEWDHPDLIKNYDFRASWDINENDSDPKPRYDRYNYNKHGTRCAGEIAAVADNQICSVGVAYNCRIGGIRMLDGEVTDLVEATALSYNRDYIDIYSASWGPDDDGKTVDGPGFLALKAIEDGIKFGRRGLGSIYVWASGNGGKDDDNCNCDGYTNSIYTISISSATQNGNIPWYSEACSSTIATTFSSGSYDERQIITTDLRKSCTEAHTGTSASAPLAAGIIALTLEANSELTWRDIQHIIVETANPANLSSSDWQLNGANRRVSHSFGYGMLDAGAMVDMAKTWVNVPQQRKCIIEYAPNGHFPKPIPIPKGDRLVIELFSTGCKGTKNEINYLEHVQAVISIQSNLRGTLVVYLRSPTGTNSTLLDKRMLDQSTESFNKWPFTTIHMWGEVPHGTWTLEIKNNAKNTSYLNLNLMLYGTKENPRKRAVNQNPANQAKSAAKEQETPGEAPTSAPTPTGSASSTSSPIGSSSLLDQRNKKAKLDTDDTGEVSIKQTGGDSVVNDPLLFSNGLNYLNQKNSTFWDEAVNQHSTPERTNNQQAHHHHHHQPHHSQHKHAGAGSDQNAHNSHLIDLKYFQTKTRTQTEKQQQQQHHAETSTHRSRLSSATASTTQRYNKPYYLMAFETAAAGGKNDEEASANSEINLSNSNNEYDADFYENQEPPSQQFQQHQYKESLNHQLESGAADDYSQYEQGSNSNNDNGGNDGDALDDSDDLLPTRPSNSEGHPLPNHQMLSHERSSHFLNSILSSSSAPSALPLCRLLSIIASSLLVSCLMLLAAF